MNEISDGISEYFGDDYAYTFDTRLLDVISKANQCKREDVRIYYHSTVGEEVVTVFYGYAGYLDEYLPNGFYH